MKKILDSLYKQGSNFFYTKIIQSLNHPQIFIFHIFQNIVGRKHINTRVSTPHFINQLYQYLYRKPAPQILRGIIIYYIII